MLVHHQSMEATSNEMEVFRVRLDYFILWKFSNVWEEEKLEQINLDNLAILEKYFYLLDNCNWEYNWQLGQMLLHFWTNPAGDCQSVVLFSTNLRERSRKPSLNQSIHQQPLRGLCSSASNSCRSLQSTIVAVHPTVVSSFKSFTSDVLCQPIKLSNSLISVLWMNCWALLSWGVSTTPFLYPFQSRCSGKIEG